MQVIMAKVTDNFHQTNK